MNTSGILGVWCTLFASFAFAAGHGGDTTSNGRFAAPTSPVEKAIPADVLKAFSPGDSDYSEYLDLLKSYQNAPRETRLQELTFRLNDPDNLKKFIDEPGDSAGTDHANRDAFWLVVSNVDYADYLAVIDRWNRYHPGQVKTAITESEFSKVKDNVRWMRREVLAKFLADYKVLREKSKFPSETGTTLEELSLEIKRFGQPFNLTDSDVLDLATLWHLQRSGRTSGQEQFNRRYIDTRNWLKQKTGLKDPTQTIRIARAAKPGEAAKAATPVAPVTVAKANPAPLIVNPEHGTGAIPKPSLPADIRQGQKPLPIVANQLAPAPKAQPKKEALRVAKAPVKKTTKRPPKELVNVCSCGLELSKPYRYWTGYRWEHARRQLCVIRRGKQLVWQTNAHTFDPLGLNAPDMGGQCQLDCNGYVSVGRPGYGACIRPKK